MESLRSAVHILSNLHPDVNFNKLSTCAAFVSVTPPISMKKMIEEIKKLPTLTKIEVCLTKSPHGPSVSSVKAGKTLFIEVTAWDQYGSKMKGLKISFAVNDPEVGVIIGVADSTGVTRTGVMTKKTGTLTVYATNGDITGSASVTVTPPPILTSFEFSRHDIEPGRNQPYLGEEFTREAWGIDQYGDPFEVKGLRISFTVDNPEIVNITTPEVTTNSSGHALCLLVATKIGSTIFHATNGNITTASSSPIEVSAQPELDQIDVRCSISSVEQGNSFTVTAIAWDQYGHGMNGLKISFAVSNSAIGVIEGATEITTNQNGEASATVKTKEAGTLTIYATNGNITGSIDVTVDPKTGFLFVTLTPGNVNWGVYNGDSPDPLSFSQTENAIITNVKITTRFGTLLTHMDVNGTKSVLISPSGYQTFNIPTFDGMKVKGQWHAELKVTEVEAPSQLGITIEWRAP